ncbi:hypothetical protein BB558_002888 [Smittium angustum]|uniref:Uncharacterized protein n=1 Tax=Smittium angustum TaxID=133377 RepID=A0A2U1J7E7_SMIAN|nr:hypothetical protein BB558_002888 [Smittium angustum]
MDGMVKTLKFQGKDIPSPQSSTKKLEFPRIENKKNKGDMVYMSTITEIKSGFLNKTLSKAKTFQRKLSETQKSIMVVARRRYTLISSGPTKDEIDKISKKETKTLKNVSHKTSDNINHFKNNCIEAKSLEVLHSLDYNTIRSSSDKSSILSQDITSTTKPSSHNSNKNVQNNTALQKTYTNKDNTVESLNKNKNVFGSNDTLYIESSPVPAEEESSDTNVGSSKKSKTKESPVKNVSKKCFKQNIEIDCNPDTKRNLQVLDYNNYIDIRNFDNYTKNSEKTNTNLEYKTKNETFIQNKNGLTENIENLTAKSSKNINKNTNLEQGQDSSKVSNNDNTNVKNKIRRHSNNDLLNRNTEYRSNNFRSSCIDSKNSITTRNLDSPAGELDDINIRNNVSKIEKKQTPDDSNQDVKIQIVKRHVFGLGIKEELAELPVDSYYISQKEYIEYVENIRNMFNLAEEMFFGDNQHKRNIEGSIEIMKMFIYEDINCPEVLQGIAIYGFCYEFGLGVECDFAESERIYKPAALRGNALAQSRLSFLKKYGRPGVRIDRSKADEWMNKVRENTTSSAVDWLIKAAETYNMPEAQYALGLCYHDGVGVDIDEKRAFDLYYKSARQGNPRGQGILGYCYGEGFGVKQNKMEAVKWYILAANQGESVAMYNLGYCYEDGIGVPQNPFLAVEWYKKAAEKGNAFAQNSLGYCHEDGLGVQKNPYIAVKWYRLSATQGYPWAECNLGYCYQYGIGVDEDPTQATFWYRRAANQGHARAQHNLGYCYQNGISVEKNENTAVEWYHKAADQGNIYAYHSLGYCYQNGAGVEVNLKEAVKWYKMAAVKNHPPAQLSLGYCYRNGIGVAKNDTEAFKWFMASSKSGNALAQNSLGYCYEEGIGTTQNLKMAFQYYTMSASQNNPWAICNVGYCYAQGIGVEQNLEKAVYLYRMAAQMDHARAMEKLGLALLEGVGTVKNERQAVFWFRKAAENFKHAPAMHWLGVCLERGFGTQVDELEAIHWYQQAIINGDNSAVNRLRTLLLKRHRSVRFCSSSISSSFPSAAPAA